MRSKTNLRLLVAAVLVFVAMCDWALAAYCPASGGCDEYIYSVHFSTRQHTRTDCSNYTDTTSYLGPPTFLSIGMAYNLVIVTNTPGASPPSGYIGDKCGVWIDWNQDEDFYDTHEQVLSQDGYGLFETNVTVPVHALEGTTRMRVRLMYTGFGETLSPCGSTDYGEVEDFALNIMPLDRSTNVHKSATYNPGATSAYLFDSTNFFGSRFHIDQPVQVISVGGHLASGDLGRVFAAIVSLTGPDALPLGTPFLSSEVVEKTIFNLPDFNMDFRYPLWVKLEPGDYALVFGSGELGAPLFGSGYLPSNGQVLLPDTSYFMWDGSSSVWFDTVPTYHPRFVVEAMEIPGCDVPEGPVNLSPLDNAQGVEVDADLRWSGYCAADELVNLYYTFEPYLNTYNYFFNLHVDQPLPVNNQIDDIVFFDNPTENLAGNTWFITAAPFPFNRIAYCSGIHNGPFLDNENSQPWAPTDIGENLAWGVSLFNFVSPVVWSNNKAGSSALPISFADAIYGLPCRTQYDVYLDTVNPPVNLLCQDINDWSYDPGTLGYDQTYFWKVVAKNDAGTTSTPVWSFQTIVCEFPTTPVAPKPLDKIEGVPTDTMLSWRDSASAPCASTTYDVYFGDTYSPGDLLYSDLTDTNCSPGTLEPNHTYYWQVITKNVRGQEPGPVWSFTTVRDWDLTLSRYRIIDLGVISDYNIPGYSYSRANSINNSGQVVGQSSISTDYNWHAFFWQDVNNNDRADPNEMQDLSVEFGGFHSEASAINNIGHVVGSTKLFRIGTQPFIWKDNNHNGRYDSGEIQYLELLPYTSRSYAYDLSDYGQVVGKYSSSSGTFACLWDVATNSITNLGTLGGVTSTADGINNACQVVGTADNSNYDDCPFLWTDDNGNGVSDPCEMINIGTLGGGYGRAFAINNSGQVVGTSEDINGVINAFCWQDSNRNGKSDPCEIVNIGHFGGKSGRAYSINNAGRVVGASYTIEGDANSIHALYWDSTNGLKDLSSMVCNPSGWQRLVLALEINDHGWIVGQGINDDGAWHAFLMMPVPDGDLDCDIDVDSGDLAVLCEQWLLPVLPADIAGSQRDGFVDFLDWALFANAWNSTSVPLSANWNPKCDIAPEGGDGVIDKDDLALFVNQWLQVGAYCADIAPKPDGDGFANMFDYAIVAQQWMEGH